MAEEEPLYCPTCGRDWTKGCSCPWPEVAPPPREERYCHICGVIPADGLECPFYDPPGRNKDGCNHVIDRTPEFAEEGMAVFRIRISGHADWGGCVVHVDVMAFDEVTAIKDVLADLARDAPPEDLAQLKFEVVETPVTRHPTTPASFIRTFIVCNHMWRNPCGVCLGCDDYIDTQRGEP